MVATMRPRRPRPCPGRYLKTRRGPGSGWTPTNGCTTGERRPGRHGPPQQIPVRAGRESHPASSDPPCLPEPRQVPKAARAPCCGGAQVGPPRPCGHIPWQVHPGPALRRSWLTWRSADPVRLSTMVLVQRCSRRSGRPGWRRRPYPPTSCGDDGCTLPTFPGPPPRPPAAWRKGLYPGWQRGFLRRRPGAAFPLPTCPCGSLPSRASQPGVL